MNLSVACLLVVSFSAAGAAPGDKCASSAKTTTASVQERSKDIVDTAVAAGSFKTLAAALDAAGLVETLKGKGPFTVFAPTDAAFAALPEGTLKSLLEPKNKGTLQSILTYHVVSGSVAAVDVVKLQNAVTVNGQRLDIRVSDDGVRIDGAKVTQADIRCSNGIIHVIDAVILPSTNDIVATAVKAGTFKTLAAALEAAGLVEALKGKGPFTVFAPTDEAFGRLPAGTLASLLEPGNKERLAAILKYHVVSGRVFSDAAAKGATVETLQGGSLRTRSEKGQVFVNEARVVSADIDTSNGVVHVIDSVLLPK
jgi:uncharacterized surface protein with fasciclin (FAS1) repeats